MKMGETKFADFDFPESSNFIFKVNPVFNEEEDNPSEKIAIVEEKLESIDINGI